MKMCCKCGEIKPLSQFHKRGDGHRNECKDCHRKRNRKNYLKNRDARLIAQKLYHEEHRDERLKYMRDYDRANRETIQARQKRWKQQNQERLKKYFSDYYQARRNRKLVASSVYRTSNRDAVRAWNNARKAKQRNADIADFTPQQWTQMKAAYRYRCAYCGIESDKLTMDHIVPLSKGGNHTLSNIVPACMKCNCKKGIGDAPPIVITPNWEVS